MREAAAARVAAALTASEGDARVSDAMEADARSGDPETGDARDARGGAFTKPSRDPSAAGPSRAPAVRLSTPRRRPLKTTRVCALCPTAKGDGPAGLLVHVEPSVDRGGVKPPPMGDFAGPFLPDKNGIKHTWAHQNCIMWCPEVYFDARLERLKHVEEAIKRGKLLKCSHCTRKGAAIGCTLPSCNRTYHLKCAHAAGCRFNAERFAVMCPAHKSQKRTPAPVWSKTMDGDEALKRPANDVNDEGTEDALPGPDDRGPNFAPNAENARPVDSRTKTLLERLSAGAGPAPNASGRPSNRRNEKDDPFFVDEEEIGFERPKAGMSKIERTRGVIRSVTAAGERVRRKEEGLEDDETAFAAREKSRFVKDKNKTACVTVGGSFGFGGMDGGFVGGFETLAGMDENIRVLKELALLPLTYPETFARLGVGEGRGVLLHGPPGTGKTAAVRALVGAAARGPHPVSFFSRKGADALGKYMGEAERSLRVLFQEASRRAPSIIFFDEIDGLAPARKQRGGEQDQIHGSVVATLLALMDGLESRGRVVVIAATNRPDAVDPALRRPGRFDREVRFSLPGPSARLEILKTHTRTWVPRPNIMTLQKVVDRTEGAAGADLRAVSVAATLSAVRRRAPSLLSGDATRESLAAALEPFLPDPEGFEETTSLVERLAFDGHRGAVLANRKHEALGERVAVFWSGNDAFFEGTVTAFDKGAFAHRVTYDDGEAQWLQLWRENEVVRWSPAEFGVLGAEAGAEGASRETREDAFDENKTETETGTGTGTPGSNRRRSFLVSEALAAAEAKEAAATKAARNVARNVKADAPDAALVSCKKKLGVLVGKRSDADGAETKYHITCLCASCVSSGAPAFDPRRWEAHCGAGHTKKWKSTVRVELDDARVFVSRGGDDDANANAPSPRVASAAPSRSVPVGVWLEMRETRGMSADAIAAAVSRDESARTAGPSRGVRFLPRRGENADEGEKAVGDVSVSFDAAACRAEALSLRAAFARSEARAARTGGGFKVTARDWARALATTSTPCSRRSASGFATAIKASPLPRRVAPALAPACLAVARALRDARAPLDVIATRALDEFQRRETLETNCSYDRRAAEATLSRAGLLEGRRSRRRQNSAAGARVSEEEDFAEDLSDAFGDDEEDFGEEEAEGAQGAAVSAASAALASAAASVSGAGLYGGRPRSARVLVHADGDQGQQLVVAAAAHALQGAPMTSLSLASLIAEGEGDACRGVIQALKEPLRSASRAPSVVHLASLETWALAGVTEYPHEDEELFESPACGVTPSHLWDAFEQTVFSAEAGFGEDGCLIVLADTRVSVNALPERIERFFEAGAFAGGGADCTRFTVGIEPPTGSALASLLARGAAASVRGAVAPALAAAAKRDARARRTAEADERADVETRKRRRYDDGEELKMSPTSNESAAAEWRRLERFRLVESELLSRRKASYVLSEKARVKRDAVRRGVALTASSLIRDARFKPALKDPTKTIKATRRNDAFRAAAEKGAAGEFQDASSFLAALQKASGVIGSFKGNVPDKWGVYPSRKGSHFPSDRDAAVAAALDRAASLLSSDDARLFERRAAEAEAAAEAAREEMAVWARKLETILNENEKQTVHDESSSPGKRGSAEEGAAEKDAAKDAAATPRTPAAAAAADAAAPLSATPSAKALSFAADVAGAVRETGHTVTRDESVVAAAAALAKALVEALVARRKNEALSFGAAEKALGAVSELLTRAARAATGARALNLPGLIADACDDIERVCAACVEEDGRGG